MTLFACSVALVGFAYVGYPLTVWLRALVPRPIRRSSEQPNVSIVIAAYREAGRIADKLASLAAQDYPRERVEVIVACDGSDDGTCDIAERAGARVLRLPRGGKPAALNAGVAAATGEIVIMTDARQALSPNAVRALVTAFGDAEVGAVSGALELSGGAPVGAYWRYEAWLRRNEAVYGSTIGVSGALYAMRRDDWLPLPIETVLDDLYVPMRLRLFGKRVTFEPEAKAFDVAVEADREFGRKVRTLSGNFQLLALMPTLLSPLHNPSWFDFVSHKLLRLVVPWALIVIALTTPFLPLPFAITFGAAQIIGYGMAIARLNGFARGSRLFGLAETFVVLNAAAVAAVWRSFRFGRKLPWS
jgi:biofilm PGA synthesis N-glycosyltransferase PgaC